MKEEPSVLDYLKSKLTPWRGEKFDFPVIRSESVRDINFGDDSTPKIKSKRKQTGWLFVLMLLFLIIAQSLLEPPDRSVTTAIFLYGIAIICFILLVVRNEWQFPKLPSSSEKEVSLHFKTKPLLLVIVFALISLLAFGGNKFTSFNVTLWVITIALVIYSLWLGDPNDKSFKLRVQEFLKNPYINITISPFTLVFILAAILVIFFRFYRIDTVLSEMFSDQGEKLLDVYDITQGKTAIFFVRNTGREAFQMYWTVLIAKIFQTGITFLSLKLGTALAGLLTLPYLYKLGKELGNRWVGLIAFGLAGVAYWPNLISRIGLRFPLYPLFAAPVLFYIIRGIRQSRRNDFIYAGIALGIGLHGYSPFRIVPLIVLALVLIYLLHTKSKYKRAEIGWGLSAVVLVSLIIFMPLLRYTLENPQMVSFRALTRLTSLEHPIPGSPIVLFFSGLWKALTMFFYSDGEIWVNSVVGRPALDIVTAVFFFIGVIVYIARYIKERNWSDLFILVSIPLLMLPSILSLAFPSENPSLNRTSGAIIPVFLLAAVGAENLFSNLWRHFKGVQGKMVVASLGLLLSGMVIYQNYDLVFNQFNAQFNASVWNSSQMAEVIQGYAESTGSYDTAYIVPYPYWVDTKLVSIELGLFGKDIAMWPDQFETTLGDQRSKLFIVYSEDMTSLEKLKSIYPSGNTLLYPSGKDGKDFYIFSVPAVVD